jgi:hypothetical protein
MVMDMLPRMRGGSLTREEQSVGIHLRGNAALYEGLTDLIRSRIQGRASVPEPTDPVMCKSMVARDRELQWLLVRLEAIYHSPVVQPGHSEGEQPAA